MFDFGKSLLAMGADEQQKALDGATSCQRRTALEMGVGFNNQFKGEDRGQTRQQKRDAYQDLDRLNHIVEVENNAHDFFTKGLADWRKGVTGMDPSGDATNLKKQFDDYERSMLSTVPKGGRRHTALSESLPKIKDTFLKQGHQFALDKLNERSRTVLDKGLRRIAKGALGARDEKAVQAHDDAAFDLINKYVLSEAKFDEKDADAAYGKYLGYAEAENENTKQGDRQDAKHSDMRTMEYNYERDGGDQGEALPYKRGAEVKLEMFAAADAKAPGDGEDEEERADNAKPQIPDDRQQGHVGSQHPDKGKTNLTAEEKPSERPLPTKKPEPDAATGKPETPEQRAELREVTPTVPETVVEEDKKKGLVPYAPGSYQGRKLNTRPGGEDGPTLTFENDNSKNPSPDRAVHPNLATAVEEIAAESGLDLNINSTTGGEHGSSSSRHYQGKAIDINEINGIPVGNPANKENEKKLQEIMCKHKGMRECYGPQLQERNRPESSGRKSMPGMRNTHRTHIHFAVQ